nr:immunoglobulin light chain junction region [Macaca mulatta]MPO03438.1 immunoglobulin light chain junction region [Macaca mulatta]MPO03504.1 immunoglobulin light chain junction region [Macaca mulatta]MPO04073.1 immunoglobulin light chain junction region [Macaca mulatta]MPO04306.1 immunoglobulin light chain junction region [Macaca mulatta]
CSAWDSSLSTPVF